MILHAQALNTFSKMFNQKMILKLINFGIDFGEECMICLYDDIIDENGESQPNFIVCSPQSVCIKLGYTWLLKKLYELEPERVKNAVKDDYEMLLKERHDWIQRMKNDYPTITVDTENEHGIDRVWVEHPDYYDSMIDEWEERGPHHGHVRNDGSHEQPSSYDIRFSDEDEKYLVLRDWLESIMQE